MNQINMRHFPLKNFMFCSILCEFLLGVYRYFGFSLSCFLCWDSDMSGYVWRGIGSPQVPIYADWSVKGCRVTAGSRAFQSTPWKTSGILREQYGGYPTQDS